MEFSKTIWFDNFELTPARVLVLAPDKAPKRTFFCCTANKQIDFFLLLPR